MNSSLKLSAKPSGMWCKNKQEQIVLWWWGGVCGSTAGEEWHSGFRGPCQGKPAGMASSHLLIYAVVRWDGGVWREDRC